MTFLTPKILEERKSRHNGKIIVKKMLGLGIYIEAGGLTQSGGIVRSIWQDTIKKLNRRKDDAGSCLILGFGAGSVAEVIQKYYPNSLITGVDVDPVMIEMGKKYLDIPEVDVEIEDAGVFINKCKKTHDLIIVDLYQGDRFPVEFEKEVMIKRIKNLLNKNGSVVFNRLYYGEKRKEAVLFAQKLEKLFTKVDYYYPEANLMLICT